LQHGDSKPIARAFPRKAEGKTLSGNGSNTSSTEKILSQPISLRS
jgi:hypothetical protein